MLVDGTEYGEVRQYGNFSFARIYESGHEVPYYQRKPSPAFVLRAWFLTKYSHSCRLTGLV